MSSSSAASDAPRYVLVYPLAARARAAVVRNLLDGPILIGVPEGDEVPCEAQPTRAKCWAESCPQSWRPQRDSNPRFGLERATSWASGRWGQR